MKENKLEIINQIRKLCNMTRALEDLVIETGYFDYSKVDDIGMAPFIPSEKEEEVSALLLRWKDENPPFGYRQSIEGDSGYGIIHDAMKAISKFV